MTRILLAAALLSWVAGPALAQDAFVVLVEKKVAAGTVDLGTPVKALRTLAKTVRIKALDGAVTVDEVELFFSDGHKQVERFGVTLQPGQATRDVTIKGLLGRWIIRMELKGSAAAPARLQLLGSAGGWTTLIESQVDTSLQQHVFVSDENTQYTAIRLGVEDAALQILELTVEYASGEPETFAVRQWIERNGLSRVFDLRGGSRLLRKVTMTYRARDRAGGKARVRLYAGKALIQTAKDQEWKRILQRNLPRRNQSLTHGGLFLAGKLSKVYLTLEGPAQLTSVQITFGDNTTQSIPPTKLGKANAIQLTGGARTLKKVTVGYRYTTRGFKPAVFRVFGQ